MKAVGLTRYLPISDPDSLIDLELDTPAPKGHDILVEVKAISVNPVDTKVRAPKDAVPEQPKVLGWDAAGTVTAIGDQVTGYAVGDSVYYAGDVTRQGTNSQFHLVDERIVGTMPTSLDFAQAAALPLTGITAWEGLFERLGISKDGQDEGKSLLIVNGAGGVGSIAIQLAKKLAKLDVIATASRPETSDWCKQLGADTIVNHRKPLADELKAAGYETVDYILCLNDTDGHWAAMTQLIRPQGMICSVVENREPLAMDTLKTKSAGIVWEFMFTRAMFKTDDMIEQQHLLNRIGEMVDAGELVTTCNKVVKPINAANLRKVHAEIEKGGSIGKIVLSDWE
ncbi:zinc-binding alcohol dehydrogenase family protein [Marinobacter sp. V034]|uniref:zinc-binding alcohol dehydrogenase family protein n=1 Tax=Marinobacter sp. V034 TaxID=3459610 RepID=UPI00404444DC